MHKQYVPTRGAIAPSCLATPGRKAAQHAQRRFKLTGGFRRVRASATHPGVSAADTHYHKWMRASCRRFGQRFANRVRDAGRDPRACVGSAAVDACRSLFAKLRRCTQQQRQGPLCSLAWHA